MNGVILTEKWKKFPVMDCINMKFVVLSNVGNEAGVEPRINLKVCTLIMRKGKNVNDKLLICFNNFAQYSYLWFWIAKVLLPPNGFRDT